MCGISGLIFKGVEPDWKLLYNMTEHQTMRGPDHTGFWINGNVGFGHNRLSIVDTSDKGNQPMETDRWVLVYNGEIYNYQHLRTKISPRQWKSYNDTETLLFYIDEKGIDKTLQDIDGMFAFAAFDKFERKLYLATDPLGIKPLYWYKDPYMFAFASSPGALTNVKSKWHFDNDKSEVFNFLALGATFNSLFSDIEKVYGGHLLVHEVDSGFTTGRPWYERKHHPGMTVDELKNTVVESIRSVKQADVPVFMFLSGGVDSSLVASECQFMNAVHLASPEEGYAREVATKYDNPLSIVHPKDYSAEECLKDYAFKTGDCSMAALIPYIVSKEVSKIAKVAISSNGADELFVGYDRIKKQPSEAQFYHIFREYFIKKGTYWGEQAQYLGSRQLELQTYVQFDLNKTLDFASMCHGLEVRVPYLNKSVVEAAMSLDYDQHVNGLGNKSILKSMLLERGFSKEFVQRPKLGFSLHYEPADYKSLQEKGKKLLKDEFNIDPVFIGMYKGRDERYYAASAAAFYCWFEVWKDKLIF